MLADNNSQTLKLKLDTMVEPDSKINNQDATDQLYRYLSSPSVQNQLSIDLSKKLDTELQVYNIDKASVMIELIMKNFEKIENIKSLSDTGVLSNILGSLLLTPKYMSLCKTTYMYKVLCIDAMVDDMSYKDLMAYAKGY